MPLRDYGPEDAAYTTAAQLYNQGHALEACAAGLSHDRVKRIAADLKAETQQRRHTVIMKRDHLAMLRKLQEAEHETEGRV